MLREEVFPEIQAYLGPRRWRRAIFQQVTLFTCCITFGVLVAFFSTFGHPLTPLPPLLIHQSWIIFRKNQGYQILI